MTRSRSTLAKVINAVIIIVVMNMIGISGYYMIYAMSQDETVPAFIRITFIQGVLIFFIGLAYVIWDRVKMSENETFRRERW